MGSFDFGFFISAFNWKFIFLLVPVFFIMVLDTICWKLLLGSNHPAPRFTTLLQLQIGTESLLFSLPGGFAMTDPAKIYYLQRHTATHPVDTVGSLIARRWMIGISQILFVLIGLLLTVTCVNSRALTILGLGKNITPIIITAFLFIAVLAAAARALSQGNLGKAFIAFLQRVPLKRIQRWAHNQQAIVSKADEYFRELGKSGAPFSFMLVGIYFLSWLMNAAETYAISAYFNMPLSLPQAVAIEALLSIVTLSAFFLPSGAVVKDLGYAGLFSALAVSTDAQTVLSFIVFKRLITLVWIAIGYSILAKIGFLSFLFRKHAKKKNILDKVAIDSSSSIS